jgi:hypothetical protein
MSGIGLDNAVSSVTRVLVGVTAVAVVAVTGCSSKGVPYQSPSSAASAAPAPATAVPGPTGSMTPVAAASGQLTGTQLEAVLLPQSFFPAGFTLASSSQVSSGDTLTSAPPQYDPATADCTTFINNFGNTGFGETAMAAESAAAQSEQAFDQVVYQFAAPGAASAFVSGIQSLAGRCHSFTATDNGAKGTFSLRAAPGPAVGGHSSVELTESGVLNGSSLALNTLLSASGVDVFAGAAVGLGVGAPTSLATETIVYNLMKRQAAAAVLGG